MFLTIPPHRLTHLNVLAGQQTLKRPHSGEESPRLIALVSHYGMEIMGEVVSPEGLALNRQMAAVKHVMAPSGY